MAVKFIWRFRTAAGTFAAAEHFLIPLYKNQICPFIELRPHNLHGSIVMGDGVFLPPPSETLHFGGFQEIIEFHEQFCELAARLHRFRQSHEILHASGTEHGGDFFETRIHQAHVFRQFLHEQIERLVSGIQFYRRFDIPLHGVWLAVVANSSERLVRAEQSIRTTERLDDVLIVDDLVEVQRVDPLGIETCQHLINHNQQIQPLLTVLVDRQVRTLVGKPRGDVLLHLRPCGDDEILVEQFVVIADDFLKRILLEDCAVGIVDVGVEQRGHVHLRSTFLEQMVIADRLGNGTRGQHRMEFVASAQQGELVENILHDLVFMWRALRILRCGQIVLNAFDMFSGLRFHGSHRHLLRIHVMVEHLSFRRVYLGFLNRRGFRFLQCDRLTNVLISVGQHHVRVESEHIAIADAVGDAVSVKAIAEHH